MKYWDTSALLRAWKEGWKPAEGMTRPHTLSEWTHVQCGRGLLYILPDGSQEKRTLSRPTAANEVERMVSEMQMVELTGPQIIEALKAWAAIPGLKANSVHDFLHIRAAELHNAKAIVTLNVTEWARMTTLRLEPPVNNGSL